MSEFPEEEDYEKMAESLKDAIDKLSQAKVSLEDTLIKITYVNSYPIEVINGYTSGIELLIKHTDNLLQKYNKAYSGMAQDINRLDEFQMKRKSGGWFESLKLGGVK